MENQENKLEILARMIKESSDAESILNFITENNISLDQLSTYVTKTETETIDETEYETGSESYKLQTLLMVAIEHGKEEVVNTFIKLGVNINFATESRNLAILVAVEYERTEIVKALIEAGANVNVRNGNGETPIVYAANYGHTEIAKALIEAGADVTNISTYTPPLVSATIFQHFEIVKILLKAGANPNAADLFFGRTAITYISRKENLEITKILLEAGADPNALDREGHTALMHLAEYGDIEVAKALIEAGANPNAVDRKGRTALIHAAQKSNSKMVRYLLQEAPNLDLDNPRIYLNSRATNLLFEAALDIGDTELLASFLLTKKYHMQIPNTQNFQRFSYEFNSIPENARNSAIQLAKDESTKPLAIKILAEELNIIQSKKFALISSSIIKNTALKEVAGITEISKLIFEYSGWQKKWSPIPQLTVESQNIINSFFDNQYKAYLLGIESGNIRVIKMAIEKSININITDSQGDSILHIIVSQANVDLKYIPEIIDLLIKKGINLEIKNIYGKTALDIARENFAIEQSRFDETVISLLESYQNNNISGKKRSINTQEIDTESTENSKNKKFRKVEEQEQESSTEIQNQDSGTEISLSMGITQLQHNFVQEDKRSNYFSPMQKILDILIPKFAVTSIAPESQVFSNQIKAEAEAKLLTASTFKEPKLETNSETKPYYYSNLLTGIKALDVATDLFKTILQPTTENLNIFMRDAAYLGVMVTYTSSYLPIVILSDMSAKAYNGEYEKFFIQGITAGAMLLPISALQTVLGSFYTASIIAYSSYKTCENLYSLYSDYGTPEFQLKSNLAYSNIAFNAGFELLAKKYLISAELIVKEDLALHNNPDSEVQQIALEYDFAGMLAELQISH